MKYHHMIDDHNNCRHQVPSIEGCWITHRWADQVFSFISAITEVNCYNAFIYFVWGPTKQKKVPDLHQFRKQLVKQLIFNSYLEDKRNEEQRVSKCCQILETSYHKFATAPLYAKKYEGNLYGKERWSLSTKDKYPQRDCVSCGKKVQTYCSCNLVYWMCLSCHPMHVRESWNKEAVVSESEE